MEKRFVKVIILAICLICVGSTMVFGASDGRCTSHIVAEQICSIAERVYGPMRSSISWEAEEGETYRVSRASAADGTYETILEEAGDAAGKFTYIDKNRAQGQQYFYKVEKIKDGKAEIITHQESSEIVLAPPSDVTALGGNGQVTIKWTGVKDASGYCVFKGESKDGEYKKIADVSGTSCIDKSVGSMKTYYYKVVAYGGKFSESRSRASEAAACHTKLAAPSISAKYDESSQNISVSWKAVNGATKYYIYKRSGSGYSKVAETDKLSYSEKATKNGVHQYKVAGVYTADGKDIAGYQSSECTLMVSSIVKPSNGKKIALTFDDGPGQYTQAIVSCLEQNNAHATFFVVGNRVNAYPSALRFAYQNGNEIASHTYSHPTLTALGKSEIQSQITKTDDAIRNIIGVAPSLVRAPGGATNAAVRETVGKPIIAWSIDTLDWKTRSEIETIHAVMSKVKDGDIILLHDIHKPTKEAVLKLIPMLRNEGYELVTVSQLAQAKGYNLQSGKIYYSLR